MITLRNDFHNTTARVRPDKNGYISPRTVARVHRKLCGCQECLCGYGPCDVRGVQDVHIIPTDDGGAILTPWGE